MYNYETDSWFSYFVFWHISFSSSIPNFLWFRDLELPQSSIISPFHGSALFIIFLIINFFFYLILLSFALSKHTKSYATYTHYFLMKLSSLGFSSPYIILLLNYRSPSVILFIIIACFLI